jgi:formylglycine-generating enzyme required for sulfatase activity
MCVAAAVCAIGVPLAPCQAADDADMNRLLHTFVEELVAITPGEGKFPAELVRAEAGRNGADQPIKLNGAFAIAKYEVPQNLYEAVTGTNPSRWKGPRNSVEMMNWLEARQFCRRLTTLLRDAGLIDAAEEIRLPTEVEWEYCCRAGTTTQYSFGDAARAAGDEGNVASVLNQYAWHTGNAKGNDPPVGALKPNPWGLYDMHGYLWEFCSDAWVETVAVAPAAAGDASPEQIVIRGGSWKDTFDDLTSASRQLAVRHGCGCRAARHAAEQGEPGNGGCGVHATGTTFVIWGERRRGAALRASRTVWKDIHTFRTAHRRRRPPRRVDCCGIPGDEDCVQKSCSFSFDAAMAGGSIARTE